MGSASLDMAALEGALARLKPRREEGVAPERKAAVAAVFREADGGLELLFIRRAEHPRDPWSGQMGLPGGRVDPGDASPLAAAVRETSEEVGLDLEEEGRLLGTLSEVRTHLPFGSVPHSVVPFAFSIRGNPSFRLNHEVGEAIWVPISFLLEKRNRSSMTWVSRGLPLPMPCYSYEGRVIWGLTLRIVDEVLEMAGPE